jgi:hypothetical protein
MLAPDGIQTHVLRRRKEIWIKAREKCTRVAVCDQAQRAGVVLGTEAGRTLVVERPSGCGYLVTMSVASSSVLLRV